MKQSGVLVVAVFPDSLAEEAGIRPGDKLLEINGEAVLDQLNYQYLVSSADETRVLFERPDGKRKKARIYNGGDGLGLDLAQDEIKVCKQNCIFCFVQQMPKDFRQSLYLKDEDIRLSFLYGHFSTLSSSDDAELDRVIRERLSPLHISVHATDPETRIRLVRNPKEGQILKKIDRLIQGGIQMHTQVVLLPGINDGWVWEKTLEELWARRVQDSDHGGILSLSCVPVGLTAHRQNLPEIENVSAEYAAEWVRRWTPEVRRHTKANGGEPWLLLADEWFARGGTPLPGRDFYSRTWAQLENGVGLIRRFQEHARRFIKSPRAQKLQGRKLLLLTGESFAPYLETTVARLNRETGSLLRVMPVKNRTFGECVTVAGLLCGQDILRAALSDREKHENRPDWVDAVLVPSASLCEKAGPSGQYATQGGLTGEPESVFLDDMTLRQLQESLGVPVRPSGENLSSLI